MRELEKRIYRVPFKVNYSMIYESMVIPEVVQIYHLVM